MNYINILLISFIVSIISVPLYTKMAVRLGIIDIPDERKLHSNHIPLLGGLGIITGVAVCLLIYSKFSNRLLYYFIANAVIIAAGIYDDRKGLTPYQKLFYQFLASSAVIFLLKIKFEFAFDTLKWVNVDVLMILFTYFWIILVTNAINLIDGVDGLASGISFMAYGSLLFAAGHGSLFNTVVCLSMLGGILGFLRYNMPKASVFMGDTGSLFLGFNIAVVSIASFGKTSTLLSVLIPALFISIPIFDTFSAFILRAIRKKNPLKADRQHLHYRLLDLNLTPAQTLIVFYSLSILLTFISIIYFRQDILLSVLSTAFIMYMFILAIQILNKPGFREAVSKFTSGDGGDPICQLTPCLNWMMMLIVLCLVVASLVFYQLWYGGWDVYGTSNYFLYAFLCAVAFLYEPKSGNAPMFRCFLIYWIMFGASYVCIYYAPHTLIPFAAVGAVLMFLSDAGLRSIYRILFPLDLLNFFMVIMGGIYIYADFAGWIQVTVLSLLYYIPCKIFLLKLHQATAEQLI